MTVAPLGIGSVTTRYSSCSSGVSAGRFFRSIFSSTSPRRPTGSCVKRILELGVTCPARRRSRGAPRGRRPPAAPARRSASTLQSSVVPCELLGRHEPAQDALVGVAPAAGDLEIDPLLAFLLRASRRARRSSACRRPDRPSSRLASTSLTNTASVYCSPSKRLSANHWHRASVAGPVALSGDQRWPSAMGQQPIDQFLGLGRLGRNLFEGQRPEARNSAGDWLQGSEPCRRSGARPASSRFRLASRSSSFGGGRLAVHFGQGQGQMGQRAGREPLPLAVEPVGQGEVGLAHRRQGVQQNGLGSRNRPRPWRRSASAAMRRPCQLRVGHVVAGLAGQAQRPDRPRRGVTLALAAAAGPTPAAVVVLRRNQQADGRADAGVELLGLRAAGLAGCAQQLLQPDGGHQVAGGRLQARGDPADLDLARRRRGQQHVQQAPLDRRANRIDRRRLAESPCPRGGSTQAVVSAVAEPEAAA